MDEECLQKLNKTTLDNKYSDTSLITEKKSFSNSFKISHKSFLEVILSQIKSSQKHLLNNNLNMKSLKQYLKNFNDNLKNLEIERNINKQYIENKIKNKKIELQKKLYNKLEVPDNQYNSIDDIKYFKNNQEQQIDYFNEKSQLKLLTFKIENEINRIDFEFTKKLNTILNLKIARLYQEEDLEIVAQNKKLKLKTIHLMKENLKEHQKILLSKVKTNLNNNKEEKKIRETIKKIKSNLGEKKKHKQYLSTNNTIIEEQKSSTTRSQNTDENEYRESNSVSIHGSNTPKGDIFSIDLNKISEKINNKLFRSLSNKMVKRKNVQFFNNNLNVNIN